ncbi:UNVERIFIED_ORG: hypothetical protein ABID57_000684 [Arthrobacter sp. UYEF1]
MSANKTIEAEAREIAKELYSDGLYGATGGDAYIADATAAILALTKRAQRNLPKAYTEEQILTINEPDQEYMRGYNCCLEDIAALEPQSEAPNE